MFQNNIMRYRLDISQANLQPGVKVIIIWNCNDNAILKISDGMAPFILLQLLNDDDVKRHQIW